MSGTIGLSSTLGQGSTFWVELLILDGPQLRADQDTDDVDTYAPDPDRTRTVLCIEDNPANLELIEQIVKRRPGIRLLTAIQGALGFELACTHRPDLIFIDLHLPDVPGDEVLRRLQAEEALRAIPVVVLSADASPGQITRLRRAGARDYLTKPLDVQRFLQFLDELLEAPVTQPVS